MEAHNAHSIILALNGKQPQETNGSGSSEISNNVSKPQLKLSELSAGRERSSVRTAGADLFHNSLQLGVAGLKSTKVQEDKGQVQH